MHARRTFPLFLAALLLSPATAAPSAPPPPKDELRIVSVVPAGAVSPHEDVTFTFELDVTLETADEAWLNLGFNNYDRPGQFRMVSQFLLHRGMERVKIAATVRPKDWGRSGEFAAILNIGPRELGISYTPTTSVRHPIPVLH